MCLPWPPPASVGRAAGVAAWRGGAGWAGPGLRGARRGGARCCSAQTGSPPAHSVDNHLDIVDIYSYLRRVQGDVLQLGWLVPRAVVCNKDNYRFTIYVLLTIGFT